MASSLTLRRLEVQPRRAGPPPAGLDVQGHGPDDGDPARRGPGHDDVRRRGRCRPAGWRAGADDTVKTYANDYPGSMNLVRATLRSDNSVYAAARRRRRARAGHEDGADMGITSPLHSYPAEGLGGLTDGVSPLEMARAYATIASGGYRYNVTAIRKVDVPRRPGRATLGKPQRRSASSPTARPTRRRRSSSRTSRPAPGTATPQHRLPGGRQDRHGRRLTRRLVRRLHAAAWRPPSGSATRTSRIPHAGRSRAARSRRTIWGAVHEGRARARYCGEFTPPTTPFVGRPFFGKYAGGAASRASTPRRRTRPRRRPARRPAERPATGGTSPTTHDGTGTDDPAGTATAADRTGSTRPTSTSRRPQARRSPGRRRRKAPG